MNFQRNDEVVKMSDIEEAGDAAIATFNNDKLYLQEPRMLGDALGWFFKDLKGYTGMYKGVEYVDYDAFTKAYDKLSREKGIWAELFFDELTDRAFSVILQW